MNEEKLIQEVIEETLEEKKMEKPVPPNSMEGAMTQETIIKEEPVEEVKDYYSQETVKPQAPMEKVDKPKRRFLSKALNVLRWICLVPGILMFIATGIAIYLHYHPEIIQGILAGGI